MTGRTWAIMAAVAAGLSLPTQPGTAGPREDLAASLPPILERYLAERSEPEHISAVSVSVGLPGDARTVDVAAGRVSRDPGAAAVTPEHLFQIGSITKSFTSAALLQLQTEGKLSLDDTVGRWLPQYPAWKDVTLRRLLTMTSGIAGYDNAPAMTTALLAGGIGRRWSDPVLVGFVDPAYPGAPAPTTGYNYSNTNYVLAGMVVEAATGRSYAREIADRFLGPRLGLADTHYSPDVYPPSILDRMVSGYFWNKDPDNAALAGWRGWDMKRQDMSWASSAGGIVSKPREVVAWARALFTSGLLTADARAQMMRVVSTKTGLPIPATTEADPQGFGLGVVSFTKAGLGSGWYYQGETMGYRMIYAWFPATGVVIAIGVNSQPSEGENKVGELLATLHAAVATSLGRKP